MFQFFKRTGQKHHNGASVLQKSLEPRNFDYKIENSRFVTLEDDDCDLDTETPQSSRLSKTLSDVLNDKNALSYFIQFLNQRNGLNYIKCYLDIQYFRSLGKTSEECSNNERCSLSEDCDSFSADSKRLVDELRDISFKMSQLGLKVCGPEVISDRKLGDVLTETALRIFKKYIALEGLYFIGCSDQLRNELIESICSEEVLSLRCFDGIQGFVYEVLEEGYYNAFVRSPFNCKYYIDVLTSGNLNLQDVLYNESILFYFMEFLEQEGLGGLLEFWLAATNFRAGFHANLDTTQSQKDAIVLYEKYFSLQATNPLGFGDKIRFQIESNICHEQGILQNCFSTPIKLIEHYLTKNHLKQFISSQPYFKYLSELISTVQTFGVEHPTHKRSNSDGSSVSSHVNPESERPSRKNDMSIDTRQLYDPDSLWRRRKTRRLSFGRITDLGRFETDVEPDPGKRESKLTKAVKRLINMEETNTKEEMAWQIAEMIVKDVTNITLRAQPKT